MSYKLTTRELLPSQFRSHGDKVLVALLSCAFLYGALNLTPGVRLFTAMGRIFVDHNYDVQMAAIPVLFGVVLAPVLVIIRKMEEKL